MGALGYLNTAGLAVALDGDRLRVSPADLITPECHQYIQGHRAELLAELKAANASHHRHQVEPRRPLVLVVVVDGRELICIDPVSASPTEALEAQSQQWGARLGMISVGGGHTRQEATTSSTPLGHPKRQ